MLAKTAVPIISFGIGFGVSYFEIQSISDASAAVFPKVVDVTPLEIMHNHPLAIVGLP